MRTRFQNVDPALNLASPDHIGGIVAPEGRKDRLDPNPNLGPMFLLMLRR